MGDRWQDHAACTSRLDIDWFPEGKVASSESRRNLLAAKKMCTGCPVREPCLAVAVTDDLVGIWGGTTTSERKGMLTSRPLAPINHGTSGGYQTHRR